MKVPKRNQELITSSFEIDGFSGGINTARNIDIQSTGTIQKRKGYNTFGEMVDVLWNINKRYRKQGFSGEFTVTLPLKGTKPVYKKTLTK